MKISKRPTLLHALKQPIIAISAAQSHLVALAENGTVYTWGIGEYGQLCRPFFLNRLYETYCDCLPSLVILPPNFDVAAIAGAGFSTFILGNKAGVLSCGKNGYGELGLGDEVSRTILTPIHAFEKLKIVEVVGGIHHTLFLDIYGDVWVSGKRPSLKIIRYSIGLFK